MAARGAALPEKITITHLNICNMKNTVFLMLLLHFSLLLLAQQPADAKMNQFINGLLQNMKVDEKIG